VYDVVLGLGGRPVTRTGIRRLLEDVLAYRVAEDALLFGDLDSATVTTQLARDGLDFSGPTLADTALTLQPAADRTSRGGRR
jgi:hypothetical protein